MLDIMLKIAYLSAIGLSLYTSGWLLMKADKNRTTGALAVCQLLIIIWCIPQLFSALPMTKGMKYLAYGISYIGMSLHSFTAGENRAMQRNCCCLEYRLLTIQSF